MISTWSKRRVATVGNLSASAWALAGLGGSQLVAGRPAGRADVERRARALSRLRALSRRAAPQRVQTTRGDERARAALHETPPRPTRGCRISLRTLHRHTPLAVECRTTPLAAERRTNAAHGIRGRS